MALSSAMASAICSVHHMPDRSMRSLMKVLTRPFDGTTGDRRLKLLLTCLEKLSQIILRNQAKSAHGVNRDLRGLRLAAVGREETHVN